MLESFKPIWFEKPYDYNATTCKSSSIAFSINILKWPVAFERYPILETKSYDYSKGKIYYHMANILIKAPNSEETLLTCFETPGRYTRNPIYEAEMFVKDYAKLIR